MIRKVSLAAAVAMSASSAISAQLSPWLEALEQPNKQEQLALRWFATGGAAQLKLFPNTLSQLGVSGNVISKDLQTPWYEQAVEADIETFGGLQLAIPYGQFEQITGGALTLDLPLSLRFGSVSIETEQLIVRPSTSRFDHPSLEILTADNKLLFDLDHIHTDVNANAGTLAMRNIDVRISEWLAHEFGSPMMQGLVVGQLDMKTELFAPSGAETRLPKGLSCDDRPLWPPLATVDVGLVQMDAQWVRTLSGGDIVVAPSATLKNVGEADVVWRSKFSSAVPPYNNDQHPYLTWGMYREIDNRFEQIGRSGTKHAFFTININCTLDCGGGQILWPGCEDVYGVGTNDNGFNLGPRDEIEASTGIWESTGSFFDPGSTGSQTNSSNGTDENRMVVDDAKLNDPQATYYISSWYTVRDDIDIYNTMGFREYTTTPSGQAWNISPASTFAEGPALDAYVAPGTSTPTEAVTRLATRSGNLAVAVKVVDLGKGEYRYNYVVDNYDFDPLLNQFRLPLSASTSFSDFVFVDIDGNAANDWTVSHVGDELVVSAPVGNEQDWGMLFSFSFTTSAAPQTGDVTLISPNASNIPAATVRVPMPAVMLSESLFSEGFESAP